MGQKRAYIESCVLYAALYIESPTENCPNKSKPAQTDVHSGTVKIMNSLRNIQKSPGLYLYRGQNTPLSLNLIVILLGSLHKFPLHFLVSYHVLTYALSLHFLCSKCSIFLTTNPPLNAICEGSLT